MATTPALMTVEEFRKLEDPPGFYLELHHGEVVSIPRPNMGHCRVQGRMQDILEEAFENRGIAETLMAFRPLPEHNLWAADVGWVTWERYEQTDDEDNLGAPDIVVEVLSPSNTASELLERKLMCLENGCVELWVIDPRNRMIEITRAGKVTTFRSGDSVPVGSRSYLVDDILKGPQRS